MKGKGSIIIKAVLFIILAAGLAGVVKTNLDYGKGKADYGEAMELAGLPEAKKAEKPAMQDSQKQAGKVLESKEQDPYMAYYAQINLEALREINHQIIGWIAIPDSEVSYPLVQGEDNDYYLNRTWKREKSSVGAIFLECQVNENFHDFNTIIYGHNMRNGSMFGSLKYYSEESYQKEHPYVYLVDDNGVHRYRIYAAYEAGVREIPYHLNITDEKKKEEFIEYGVSHSLIDTKIKPGTENKIVTLSTCTGRGYSSRWVVQAVEDHNNYFNTLKLYQRKVLDRICFIPYTIGTTES